MNNLEWSKKRRRLVYGWGINDADYVVQPTVNGKQIMCPFYDKWIAMLNRGFSTLYKEKHKSYSDVTVAEEWKYFTAFKTWMQTQYWDGMELDKDILFPGNTVYSAQTCVFVPPKINKGVNTKITLNTRDCPLGVYRIRNKFRASVSGGDNVSAYLGNYGTKEEAHKVWQLAKSVEIEKLITWYATQACFRTDVAEALTQRVWKLRLDASLNIETIRGWV